MLLRSAFMLTMLKIRIPNQFLYQLNNSYILRNWIPGRLIYSDLCYTCLKRYGFQLLCNDCDVVKGSNQSKIVVNGFIKGFNFNTVVTVFVTALQFDFVFSASSKNRHWNTNTNTITTRKTVERFLLVFTAARVGILWPCFLLFYL
jgi:hypothetical protein